LTHISKFPQKLHCQKIQQYKQSPQQPNQAEVERDQNLEIAIVAEMI
jgi:hypothetical protein